MSLMKRIGAAFSRKGYDGTLTSAELYGLLSGTGYARSGAMVSWFNSLSVSTVLGCVRVVAEDIAKVDLKLLMQDGRTLNPALDHPLYDLLAVQPNSWLTSFEFREMMTSFAMLTGNAIAYKTKGIDGQVLELLPIPPPWCSILRIPGSWDLQYTITFPNGSGTIICGPQDVLHLRGPCYDGFIGADVVRFAREAIGLAMSGEEHQARIAEGSLQAPGYLTTPNTLTKEQVEAIKEFLKNNQGGVRNAGTTPLFQNALEYKEIGATGAKAEILATRQFQIEEICRMFRVFPQMVGYTDKTSTHGSAEQFFAAHVVHTLQPWAVRWEQVIIRDLLSPQERKAGYRPKLMLQDLLRGDPASRGAFYKDQAMVYAITPNEIRINEGRNPFPDPKYDLPIGPVNMDLLGQMPEPDAPEGDAESEPGKKPDPEDDEGDGNEN